LNKNSSSEKPADIDNPNFVWRDHGKPQSRSRLQIYQHPDYTIAVATEIPDNPSQSLTNRAESAVQAAIEQYNLDATKVIWVEHYPADAVIPEDTFSLVVFQQNVQTKHFCNPQWLYLTPDEVTALINGDLTPLERIAEQQANKTQGQRFFGE